MKSYEYLHKRALVTSKARYEASKRLRLHSWCSQWTLASLAVGQIFLSLLMTFNIINTELIPKAQLDVSSIFFAVAVLAYSLLLGMGDYSARSSNMHQCGLQLGELSRKLNYKIDKSMTSNEEEYLRFINDYYVCLSRHENHIAHDYLIAKLDHLKESGKAPNTLTTALDYKIKIYIYKIIGFSHYIISIFVMLAWLVYILI